MKSRKVFVRLLRTLSRAPWDLPEDGRDRVRDGWRLTLSGPVIGHFRVNREGSKSRVDPTGDGIGDLRKVPWALVLWTQG